MKNNWKFIDDKATFILEQPEKTSHLYFPLVNEKLMMSSITPDLHGDIKIDHNHFLSPPVSIFDLHNSRASRNFFIRVDGKLFAANGSTNKIENKDETQLEAGILWHKLIRKNQDFGLKIEVTNFVPQIDEFIELMKVSITNISDDSKTIMPTVSIPLYGRSADSIRDHRHVTSLLNTTEIEEYGIKLKPTLSFDERGHLENDMEYVVLASDQNDKSPQYYYTDIDSFFGEGGNLDYPLDLISLSNAKTLGDQTVNGKEAIAGLVFEEVNLKSQEINEYYIVISIGEKISIKNLQKKYANQNAFNQYFEDNIKYWSKKLDPVSIKTSDSRYDNWMRWVSLQPILRRLMGNSFLPYHDYGRGGRGWRDLWQDALGLLLLESEDIADDLYSFFAGIRMDGSNATIIGANPGEFIADRNNIPRVWMDHGVWPLKTLQVYLENTGNYQFLLKDQTYFKDHLIHRAQKIDQLWDVEQENFQKDIENNIYLGTIFEHLLIQHLTAFFNVGEHNNILLEGADWNDGMDMADKKGEGVAFTAFYAGNIAQLSEYAKKIKKLGLQSIDLASEFELLLDQISMPIDYDKPQEKQARLKIYFNKISHKIKNKKISIDINDLIIDLENKAKWMFDHLRKNEWISNNRDAWFNGYYDNFGDQVENTDPSNIRMTLTGQVFPIMSGVATEDQIKSITKAANKYLYQKDMGGLRLNTDFGGPQMNLGRAFGFAYGTKENGAMFSHMSVMYANALYERGFVEEGYRILKEIYSHCQDFSKSKMYPGLPEYIGPSGRGYYFYLTGSASWYLFTVVNQVFGIKGKDGNLLLSPKLLKEQFDKNCNAVIHANFANKKFKVTFINKDQKEYGSYKINKILLNDQEIHFKKTDDNAIIDRTLLTALKDNQIHNLTITLT